MKIRTQFIITLALFAVVLLIISASVILTDQRAARYYEQEEIAHAIERDASDLNYLSNDYLLYREPQQQARWESKFGSFAQDLSRLNPDTPEARVLVFDIRGNQQRLRDVFADVTSTLRRKPPARPGDDDMPFIQVSSSRMAVQNQAIIFDALRLSKMLRDETDQMKRKNIALIFVLLAVFGAYFVADYLLVYRRMLTSIRELQAGTEVIGAGNWNFAVAVKRNDEIGQLSQAFNLMTANLKGVTASKAELEREIAEREQAQDALRESEQRYRLLFNGMTEGFSLHEIILDETGVPCDYRFLDINPAFERLTGLSREDVIGATHNKLLPDDDPKWVQIYGEVALTGNPVHFDDYSPALDRTYEVFAYCPAPLQFAVMFTDITERKKAESEVASARDSQQLLLDHFPGVALLLRTTTREVVATNRAGISVGAVCGSKCYETWGQSEGQCPWCLAPDLWATGKEQHAVIEAEGKAFEAHWVPVSDDLYMHYAFDITEHKQSEQQLSEARAEADRRAAELESFFASQADGVSMIDGDGRILWMNDAGREILRLPPGEDFADWGSRYQVFALDGSPLLPEQRMAYRALKGERITDFRYKMVTPFGESIVLSVSASPVLDRQGRVIGVTASFRDQSERFALENEKQSLLDREHRIAEMLQQALIPVQIPTTVSGCHFVAKYVPALAEANVGGDFYDVFDLGDGKVAVLIGDVAGKGVKAAMRVSAARYAFRSYAYIERSPSRVVSLVNDALCKDRGSESGLFTAFFAVVETRNRTISYTNAGHEPPVIRRASGDLEELNVGGRVLGILPNCDYPEGTVRLEPGDLVVLVTDGITEARSEEKGMFGKDGMLQFLAEGSASPSELVDGLLAKAKEYGNGHLQDDVAIVALEVETSCVEVG